MKIAMMSVAASAVLAMSAVQGGAATVSLVIDEFDGYQKVTDVPEPSHVTTSQVANANVVGGYRELTVQNTTNGGGGLELDASELVVGGGLLSFSNAALARSIGYITYDGSAVSGNTTPDLTGLGGLNFLIGANPYFSFEVVDFDLSVDIEVHVWDMTGKTVSYAETLTPGFNPNLYFTELSGDAGFDWTKIGALQFIVDSSNTVDSVDGVLNSIRVEATVVPLPASALLLLGGISGLAMLRRRKASA